MIYVSLKLTNKNFIKWQKLVLNSLTKKRCIQLQWKNETETAQNFAVVLLGRYGYFVSDN